tara:strand:+ start:805 stop:1164 length:360 start_codon:yes stop_codon:yes gene_type:complete
MSQINNYELMWILSSEETDESQEEIVASIKNNISSSGGEISEFENYGKRKLAYELSGNKDGNYYLSRFEMDKLKINELNNKLNKENKVLRHLITVIKKEDALIAADKMDEVPETNRNRR